MRLTRVFVRFYKSFNYDYERKFARTSSPEPWELLDGAWYPYVRMDLEPSVTTIVGANESGKSHLLDAIEKLITGTEIDRSDFCRYSHFFSVQQGERRSPDFGGEFEVVDANDVDLAKKILDVDLSAGERFNLFRPNGGQPIAYLQGREDPVLVTAKTADLRRLLPSVFRLDAHLPLPASIPLYELAPNIRRPYGSRRSRRSIFEGFLGRSWSSAEEFTKAAPNLFGLLSSRPSDDEHITDLDRQYELGRSLLFRVAKVDASAFEELADAIADEREGYVNGVVQKINGALARHLNFPRWWAQDREFRLMVWPREHELVFTIRDRTGTDYSFAERSNGLRFFLSYHVQLLAHQPPASRQPEILLMDEPDAYLSSQGQQDLLRILEDFAAPEDQSRRDQVVYVTHSPFLINRNAGDRIRVLDKGVTDEGTRVVKDVARNHYEPLRSSLGGFVAETSFIGGSNLFVEGLADQVLLAGVSSHLLARGEPKIDLLDLNSVTIVPAGSASSVPYLVYLARGRDVVRPACVALLDGDSAGDDAARTLARGGARGRQLLPPEFIVRIGMWAKDLATLSVAKGVAVSELEDLVSLPVAVEAARNYAVRLVDAPRELAERFGDQEIQTRLSAERPSLFDALEAAFTDHFGPDAHIEKVGFAKEVVAVLAASRAMDAAPDGFADTEQNFLQLLARLSKLLRRAAAREDERRQNNRLNRTIAGFLADYPTATTRERGRLLIEEILESLESSDEGDRVKLSALKMRRDFELDENLTEPIDRYEDFRERVQALRYEERLAKQDEKVVVNNLATAQAVGSVVSTGVGTQPTHE
jgi:energy-coupling factor transporter ATP-binding protein EcfA2